jgi:hypothetical protein
MELNASDDWHTSFFAENDDLKEVGGKFKRNIRWLQRYNAV